VKQIEAVRALAEYDSKGRHVFTNSDLAKIFSGDSERSLRAGIHRLVASGVLLRVCNGTYVNGLAKSLDTHILECIAKAIRRGEYNYVSLESALSEYGVISQVPIDRLTVMTTGRTETFQTPFGVIEFTHTKRSVADILASSKKINRPLRLADKDAAYRDLKRVGRNMHLVDEGTLYEI